MGHCKRDFEKSMIASFLGINRTWLENVKRQLSKSKGMSKSKVQEVIF